jgi:hypothetical protein
MCNHRPLNAGKPHGLSRIVLAMVCFLGFAAKTVAAPPPDDGPRPVVTLQKYIWATSQAAFRVRVYPDHSVIYEGFVGVRVKGEQRYKLSQADYQALLRAIHDYAAHSTQADIAHHDAAAVITVALDGLRRSFYVNAASGSRHILFIRNIETRLKVKSLRCGVLVTVDNRIREICEFENDMENHWLKGER